MDLVGQQGQDHGFRDMCDRSGPVTNWANKRVSKEHTDTVPAATAVVIGVALIIAGASNVRRTATCAASA